MNEHLLKFIFPKLNKFLLIRLIVTVIILTITFKYLLMPCVINGKSMQPTYNSIGFNFATKLKYKNKPIQVGDIVVIKYINKKYFLKRVVALEGDIVEFRDGDLYVNMKKLNEPYLQNRKSDWNLKPRFVEAGNVYVVGDNRTMDIDTHKFGQVPKDRIIGGVLW